MGLSGGIGAGKSTVSALLAQRGAVIVDADIIARQIVEPDGPAYAPLVDRFGSGVLHPDGTLNRAALAAIVFADPEELQALNAITHPAINAEIIRQIELRRGSHDVVVVDAALKFDTGRNRMIGMMVVDVDPDMAVERLMTFRGFSETDARSRIGAQVSREERAKGADLVIDNSGDRDALEHEVDRAWRWISTCDEPGNAESEG